MQKCVETFLTVILIAVITNAFAPQNALGQDAASPTPTLTSTPTSTPPASATPTITSTPTPNSSPTADAQPSHDIVPTDSAPANESSVPKVNTAGGQPAKAKKGMKPQKSATQNVRKPFIWRRLGGNPFWQTLLDENGRIDSNKVFSTDFIVLLKDNMKFFAEGAKYEKVQGLPGMTEAIQKAFITALETGRDRVDQTQSAFSVFTVRRGTAYARCVSGGVISGTSPQVEGNVVFDAADEATTFRWTSVAGDVIDIFANCANMCWAPHGWKPIGTVVLAQGDQRKAAPTKEGAAMNAQQAAPTPAPVPAREDAIADHSGEVHTSSGQATGPDESEAGEEGETGTLSHLVDKLNPSLSLEGLFGKAGRVMDTEDPFGVAQFRGTLGITPKFHIGNNAALFLDMAGGVTHKSAPLYSVTSMEETGTAGLMRLGTTLLYVHKNTSLELCGRFEKTFGGYQEQAIQGHAALGVGPFEFSGTAMKADFGDSAETYKAGIVRAGLDLLALLKVKHPDVTLLAGYQAVWEKSDMSGTEGKPDPGELFVQLGWGGINLEVTSGRFRNTGDRFDATTDRVSVIAGYIYEFGN